MANRNPNLRQPNRRSAQNPQNPQQEQVPSDHNQADFPTRRERPRDGGDAARPGSRPRNEKGRI